MLSNNINGFLHATALGDDVLHNQHLFARHELESSTEDQFTVLLFDEDKPNAQLSCNFLTDDEPPHRGGNDGLNAEIAHLFSECRPQFFHRRHLFQRFGALEKLAAVQAAAENEMAFEQSAGFAEDMECFILCHARRDYGRATV